MNDVAAIARRLDTGPRPVRTGMTTYSDQVDSPHASQSHDLRATHISVSPSRVLSMRARRLGVSLREQGRKVTETTRTVQRRYPSVGEREMLPGCRRRAAA